MTKRNYKIRVRAYDINEMIIGRDGNPESIVDVIVPVKSESIKSAYKSAILKVRNKIRKGWPKQDFEVIGTWKATKVTPADIKELSR
jgi:hypothetical protein